MAVEEKLEEMGSTIEYHWVPGKGWFGRGTFREGTSTTLWHLLLGRSFLLQSLTLEINWAVSTTPVTMKLNLPGIVCRLGIEQYDFVLYCIVFVLHSAVRNCLVWGLGKTLYAVASGFFMALVECGKELCCVVLVGKRVCNKNEECRNWRIHLSRG